MSKNISKYAPDIENDDSSQSNNSPSSPQQSESLFSKLKNGLSNSFSQFMKFLRSTSYTVSTKQSALNFWSGLGGKGQASLLGTINKGSTVQGTGNTNGDWAEVTYGGKTGWVNSKYIQ